MVVITNKKKSIVFILESLLLFAYNQISKPVESKFRYATFQKISPALSSRLKVCQDDILLGNYFPIFRPLWASIPLIRATNHCQSSDKSSSD